MPRLGICGKVIAPEIQDRHRRRTEIAKSDRETDWHEVLWNSLLHPLERFGPVNWS
jgi:hypothetical protein